MSVLTKRQRERIVREWVELQLEQDAHPEGSGQYCALSHRMAGMSIVVEAIMFDPDRRTDWVEASQFADEILDRIDAARRERAA